MNESHIKEEEGGRTSADNAVGLYLADVGSGYDLKRLLLCTQRSHYVTQREIKEKFILCTFLQNSVEYMSARYLHQQAGQAGVFTAEPLWLMKNSAVIRLGA